MPREPQRAAAATQAAEPRVSQLVKDLFDEAPSTPETFTIGGDSEEEEEERHPRSDVSQEEESLGFLNLLDTSKTSAGTANSLDQLEEIEFTADSGACVTIAPEHICPDYPVIPTAESLAGRTYTTAGGGKVADKGKKAPTVQTETGAVRRMNIRLGPVRKALACIAEMCDHGHRVVFDNDGSFILDKRSGETIPMHRRHMAYTFKVKVMKHKPRPSAKAHSAATLATLDAGSSGTPAPGSVPDGVSQSSGQAASSQQGFRRQAKLP